MRRLFGFRPFGSSPVQQTAADFEQSPICPRCSRSLADEPIFLAYHVCPSCNAHLPIGARKRIASIVDQGTFRETDARLYSADPLEFADDEPYRERLEEQRRVTGQSDAIVTGVASLYAHKIVIAVLDFAFMGGSMGVVVGEKLVRATERSLDDNLPLVTIVASGGARMQEGMYSLIQMAKTAAAVQRLHAAGIPYLSVLTHPTTGGVFASFSNLGDYLVAEPEALIGFAGPRVVEQFLGHPLPPGSHTAEFLFAHGLIDNIIDRPLLRDELGSVLDLLSPRQKRSFKSNGDNREEWKRNRIEKSVWDTVNEARDPDRLTANDYLRRILDRFVEFHGDRESGDDPAIIAGFGAIDGRPVAVVGFERGHGEESNYRRHGRPLPEGFRKAQRVMRLAARFKIPVVSLIDTPGAYPGIESEERGLAGEIAETMALMSELPVPIVAAVIGEGGSGGALALAIADRVLMQERAIYSVIAPEGAAAILFRDAGRAPELAEKLKITAPDLRHFGIVDTIVSEPVDGVISDPDQAAHLLRTAIVESLARLADLGPKKLLNARTERYRKFGRAFAAKSPDAKNRTIDSAQNDNKISNKRSTSVARSDAQTDAQRQLAPRSDGVIDPAS